LRVIVGYGNSLRGEDAFGVDVVLALQKYPLVNTRIIEAFQLTPELCLELLDADEVVFVDASYSKTNQYALACAVRHESSSNLSHQISVAMIQELLQSVYHHFADICVYSLLTHQFDTIDNVVMYQKGVQDVVTHLLQNP